MRARMLRLLFADIDGDHDAAVGRSDWERRALVRSIRRVTLGFAAVWQLAMILAAFGELGTAAWGIACAAGLLGLLALVALAGSAKRVGAVLDPVVSVAMAGIGFWAYLLGGELNSALVFAGSWQINFASCVAGLLLLRGYAVPLVAATAVAIGIGIGVALPAWGIATPLLVVATQLSIIVALRWGMSRLVAVAADADRLADELVVSEQRSAVSAHVRSQLAEQSRVLHDTAINTLGAIANGVTDTEQVLAQCARDVAVLRILRTQPSQLGGARLTEMFVQPGLRIVRAGDADAELSEWEAKLPAGTVSAVVGCVREAVTNATKHSGAAHVVVSAEIIGDALTVRVSDDGIGFDPHAGRTGFGVETSILRRAADHGFAATIQSAHAVGTTVTLVVPTTAGAAGTQLAETNGAHGTHGGAADTRPEVQLHERAAELWGLGVTAVSVVLLAAGSVNHGAALLPMIAIMLASWALFRYAPRVRRRGWFLALMAVATVAVFVLAAAATSFGTDAAMHWHALAPTGPFVLLLAGTANVWQRIAAAAVWALAAGAIAWPLVTATPEAAQIVLIAAGVGLGFAGVWASFQRVLRRLGAQAGAARSALAEAELRAELGAATDAGYRRWVAAGLDTAIALLHRIAAGAADPSALDTRLACEEEERYLRQLVQFGPQLVHLGRTLVETLSIARERGVNYVLSLGEQDAPDEQTAVEVAAAIGHALRALSPGDTLRASFFPVHDGLRLTLLGTQVLLAAAQAGNARHEPLGALELAELTYATAEKEMVA